MSGGAPFALTKSDVAILRILFAFLKVGECNRDISTIIRYAIQCCLTARRGRNIMPMPFQAVLGEPSSLQEVPHVPRLGAEAFGLRARCGRRGSLDPAGSWGDCFYKGEHNPG